MIERARAAATRVGRFLLDALAPHRCPGCGKVGVVVCENCWQAMPKRAQVTPGPSPLLMTVTATTYDEPITQQLIQCLKYEGIRDAATPLGELLATALEPMRQEGDVLVPIPLHPRRERERGFNQSLLLAETIAKKTQLPVAQPLQRSRPTKPQVECSAEERRTNLEAAFTAEPVTANRIILVDDVTTTSTTFAEAAKALRKVTDAPIIGLAVARGG